MGIDLKRLKSYQNWKTDKLLVIHMITPMLDVETCLNMSKIPFEAISISDNNFELNIRKHLNESVGVIITGSRKKDGNLKLNEHLDLLDYIVLRLY